MGAVSGFGGVELTLKVDVNKAELDFSDVNFGNTRVFVDSYSFGGDANNCVPRFPARGCNLWNPPVFK